MKRIILILLISAMVFCLFSCIKDRDNTGNLSTDGTQTNPVTTSPSGSGSSTLDSNGTDTTSDNYTGTDNTNESGSIKTR